MVLLSNSSLRIHIRIRSLYNVGHSCSSSKFYKVRVWSASWNHYLTSPSSFLWKSSEQGLVLWCSAALAPATPPRDGTRYPLSFCVTIGCQSSWNTWHCFSWINKYSWLLVQGIRHAQSTSSRIIFFLNSKTASLKRVGTQRHLADAVLSCMALLLVDTLLCYGS